MTVGREGHLGLPSSELHKLGDSVPVGGTAECFMAAPDMLSSPGT